MIVVIIAGGSGTRLWPLSTPSYPKHLLKVNGDQSSLLQNTFKRAKALTGAEAVYVVSEASHIQHVKDQLPELPDDHFIVEPARRGTANCIIAVLAHLKDRHDPDEALVSIAADHYVRDTQGFAHSFKLASRVAEQEKSIVLVGIEPTRPETGFGYIEKGELLSEEDYVFRVKSFKEKPPYDVAQQYLESGNFVWNASYFMGTLNTFDRCLRDYAPDTYANYQKLLGANDSEAYEQAYLGFENIAVEYALIEKTKDLLVVPATFDWMDLGSFKDMYEAADKDAEGNHLSGAVEKESVHNSFVQNLEEKPVAVIGLDNVAVVNTPDGIVVTRLDMSQKVGDIAKRLQSKQG